MMNEMEVILTIGHGRKSGLQRRICIAEDHLLAHQIIALCNYYVISNSH